MLYARVENFLLFHIYTIPNIFLKKLNDCIIFVCELEYEASFKFECTDFPYLQ